MYRTGTYTATTSTAPRPATAKQLSFLASLLESRNLGTVAAYTGGRDLTTRTASAMIDDVKRIRPAVDAPAPVDVPTTPGIFRAADGALFVLKPTRSTGKLWAYVITADGSHGSFYGGPFKLRGAARLSEAETREAAVTRAFSHCVCCSRLLTREESIQRMMGPICAGKFF